MKRITLEELKNNLEKYIELSSEEDIYIFNDGQIVSVLTNTKEFHLHKFNEFVEGLPKSNLNIDYDEIIYEEIMKKHSNHYGRN